MDCASAAYTPSVLQSRKVWRCCNPHDKKLCKLPRVAQVPCSRNRNGGIRVRGAGAGVGRGGLIMEQRQEERLDMELARYDPWEQKRVDVAIVGSGPAGLAVAQHVSQASPGLSVCCIDPEPLKIWANNYGVWVDEFESIGLLDCVDTVWSGGAVVYIDDSTRKYLDRPYARVDRRKLKSKLLANCLANGVVFHRARVSSVVHGEHFSDLTCSDGIGVQASLVVDATGFSRCLVQYDKPYHPGYQVAYGILAQVDGHPFDVDKMLFMDWRDSHLSSDPLLASSNRKLPTFLYAMPFSRDRIFLEETSLVARPGVPMHDIQTRMKARLKHLGIEVKRVEEYEHCYIPMGGPLPSIPQRALGIGGTAGMVHPSTGYMVARTLTAAPVLAASIVKYLSCPQGFQADELSALIWKDLWPLSRRRQREFFCFGMDILLKLDLQGTRRFFDAFFDLEPYYWHGFLSSRLYFRDLVFFGLSLFAHASNVSRLEIMAKGTLPLANMIGNLVKDKD